MNLLKPISWLGTFFVPDGYSDRFAGQLEYAPGEGVLLRYLMTDKVKPVSLHKGIDEPYLHGVLDSGRRCTLLQPGGGKRTRQFSGMQSSESGTMSFGIMVLGGHVMPDQKFVSATIGLDPFPRTV